MKKIGLILLILIGIDTTARSELILLKKNLKGEVWADGGWADSKWRSFPKTSLGTINISEGEEIKMVKKSITVNINGTPRSG